MKKRSIFFTLNWPSFALLGSSFILLGVLGTGCGKKEERTEPDQKAVPVKELKPIVDTEEMPDFKEVTEPQDQSKYYDDPEFREFFGEAVEPPPFNFNINCSNKSLSELRCLRNEIYARHGYLFNDAILRGYFNQFKWYQPIFWDSSFQITLNEQEQWFVNKILTLEKKHLKQNYIKKNNQIFANTENIVNTIQFKVIEDTLLKTLANSGFTVVKSKYEQLFHVYDKNLYECIPNYVTTDLYLQLLHMHYSNLMKRLETTLLYDMYSNMFTALYESAIQIAGSNQTDTSLAQAAEFVATFYGIGLYLLNQTQLSIPARYNKLFSEELKKIKANSSMGSRFLDYMLFDYTQLKPRGHYTHSDKLSRYFMTVKWFLTAPFIVSTDSGLAAAIVSAYCLREHGMEEYHKIENLLSFLSGKPDNLALIDLNNLLETEYKDIGLSQLLSVKQLARIREKLIARDPERIVPRAVSDIGEKEFKKRKLFFMAGRYTFDAEILQRLIHVRLPKPRRPFPKGLDVFAVLGNKTAESILFNTYHEQEKWKYFNDTLTVLKKQFASFSGWNENAYNKRMDLINALFHVEDRFPYYMHLEPWNIRTLTCALAGWTHLKHEVILYAKQPLAAQCGEGGIPPPKLVGYVEPNTIFWKRAKELVKSTSHTLSKQGMETQELKRIHNKLSEIAEFLLTVSEKELAGAEVSEGEYDRIAYIGGRFENLTLSIMDTDHFERDDPERQISIVADVFTNNAVSLEESIGYGNEIYVLVEIKGMLHLTRGAVLSYFEFHQPSSKRLTDKEWQEMLRNGQAPEPPVWTGEIMIPIESLKTKAEYSNLIPGGC